MVYKNLFLRILTSIFIIIFFSTILIINNILLISLFINFIYFLIIFEIHKNFNSQKKFLFLYIFASLLIINIYLFYLYDLTNLLYVIYIIILFDSFSYFFGSKYGKRKIFPKISPNKTILGFLSGYFISLVAIFLFCILFNKDFNLSNFYLFNLIIIFSFIGDLIESFYKRKSNIKDSSNFLPGHGGFFDRFDSFVAITFLLPFVSLFI